MKHSVAIVLCVAATALSFAGGVAAQGVSVDAQTRGSGTVDMSRGNDNNSISGSNRGGGQVTAPGDVNVRGRTSIQGGAAAGGGGPGGSVGAGGSIGGGVRIGR
jgi:hypothetical protein